MCVARRQHDTRVAQCRVLTCKTLRITGRAADKTDETELPPVTLGKITCSTDRRQHFRCRVGMRTVTKHNIEQDQRHRRVGCFLQDPLVAQTMVDHRMWSAASEFVVAEVNNTPWGERHCYVLDCRVGETPARRFRFEFDKQFHVSPFMPMDQRYRWTFWIPDADLGVHMENRAEGKRQFTATMRLQRSALSGAALARVLVRYPLMTARVVTAIYWQALKLRLKGVAFHSHPKHLQPTEAKR